MGRAWPDICAGPGWRWWRWTALTVNSAAGRGKTDTVDAIEAARAAQAQRQLGQAKTREGQVEAIRALVVAKRRAIAMGYAVDDILPMGSGYVSNVAHHDQWSWPSPFLRYRELLDEDSTLALAADRELKLWRTVLDRVPDHDQALVVSHGRIIEPTLVRAGPAGEYSGWRQPFSHPDGVRLVFHDEEVVEVEFDRYRPAEA
jgi:hypothetical protein